jgi:hypothetical protein
VIYQPAALSVLVALACWRRESRLGAFFWGLGGMLLGQTHLFGFFYAGGLAAWAYAFDRRRVRWLAFLAGSVLGALPLVPWLAFLLQHHGEAQPATYGLARAAGLPYFRAWITESLGIRLGYFLETHVPGLPDHLAAFDLGPVVLGHATHLNQLALWALTALGAVIIGSALATWVKKRALPSSSKSPTAFLAQAAFWSTGALFTLSTIAVQRHYFPIVFPLASVWLAWLALAHSKHGRVLLVAVWALQLFVSVSLLGYVHEHCGAPGAGYGVSYRCQASGLEQ